MSTLEMIASGWLVHVNSRARSFLLIKHFFPRLARKFPRFSPLFSTSPPRGSNLIGNFVAENFFFLLSSALVQLKKVHASSTKKFN